MSGFLGLGVAVVVLGFVSFLGTVISMIGVIVMTRAVMFVELLRSVRTLEFVAFAGNGGQTEDAEQERK